MLFSKLKTSTRIALIFTLFSSVLLFVFVIILNAYYFYNWRIDERNEVTDRTEQTATHIFARRNGSGADAADEMNRFSQRILEQ